MVATIHECSWRLCLRDIRDRTAFLEAQDEECRRTSNIQLSSIRKRSSAAQYPQAQASNGQQQDASPQDQAADPQHGVARISIVQGDVNVKRGDRRLVAAAINAPLMAQDNLQTSPGSRAEVELDSANLIRLAPNTDIGFADLEYQRYQIQLGAGAIIYRVLRDTNAQAEIDTPSIALKPEARASIAYPFSTTALHRSRFARGKRRFTVRVDRSASKLDIPFSSAEILLTRNSRIRTRLRETSSTIGAQPEIVSCLPRAVINM